MATMHILGSSHPSSRYLSMIAAPDHSGAIRAYLSARGKVIGPHDLQIAAIARAHDLVLVTHNTKEFSRVVGLRVEDWE